MPRIPLKSEVYRSPGTDRYPNLKCCLLIFKILIRVSRVEGGIRSLAAAPDGPETRPLVSASAVSIISRSLRGSTFKAGDVSARDASGEVLLESHNSSTEKTSAELRMMDLSITFCNSRILPGQSYDCNRSKVFWSIDRIFCPSGWRSAARNTRPASKRPLSDLAKAAFRWETHSVDRGDPGERSHSLRRRSSRDSWQR